LAYKCYLTAYPHSGYTEKANKNLYYKIFDSVVELNTINAYSDFITKYPQAPQTLYAQKIRDMLAFIEAYKKNSIEGYNHFLKQNNTSRQVATVLKWRNQAKPIKTNSDFKSKQLKYENAQIAYSQKEQTIKHLLEQKNIDYSTLEILIRVIKSEEIVELWAKDRIRNHHFKLIKTYAICITRNLEIGDTLRGTDLLIPESFYYVAHFYPFSPYFARLEINFPNESDHLRGRTGGDIAIHGSCFSTYCTPLTDEDIKELYIFAVEAKSKGQEYVPVHNYPARMDDTSFKLLTSKPQYSKDTARIALWKNMKEYYDYFEKNNQLLEFKVDKKGRYVFD